jgi:formylglycine-generating enzyme required for sulfatase activity
MRFSDPAKNWIAIPGCTFFMGAQKDDPGKPNYDVDAYDFETPVHQVALSPYKIGKYPVTVGEYKKFIEDGGYDKKKYWLPEGWKFIKEQKITLPHDWEKQVLYGTRPVTGVTWFEAMAYAKWKDADLPTEAEWERAARGGIPYKKYPWGEKEPDGEITHSGHNKLGHAAPVGIFPVDCTTEGAIDMGGNVLEWCKDWYNDTEFYKKSHGSSTVKIAEKGCPAFRDSGTITEPDRFPPEAKEFIPCSNNKPVRCAWYLLRKQRERFTGLIIKNL